MEVQQKQTWQQIRKVDNDQDRQNALLSMAVDIVNGLKVKIKPKTLFNKDGSRKIN